MPTTTPFQGFPVPTNDDDPDLPDDLMKLAAAIERRVVGVYNNGADLHARVTAPQEGQVAFMKDTNTFLYYTGTDWAIMIGGQVSITSGTAVPANSSGNNGDVFFKV